MRLNAIQYSLIQIRECSEEFTFGMMGNVIVVDMGIADRKFMLDRVRFLFLGGDRNLVGIARLISFRTSSLFPAA